MAAVSLLLSIPAAAEPKVSGQKQFIRALDRMMVQLGPESARASRTIRQAYREHLNLLMLSEYAALQQALANGGLAPLPADPLRFNLAPRLTGPSPIGEKDLRNQISYIAARPATIGCLLDVASRVKSGPLEVTSLVRHGEYQSALRTTNKNATTSVPMHTMGLAFDIALVNTPLERVYEIRNVLRRMRDAGEILFIGERQQLVFHVVPQPSRLGHFTEVYAQALGAAVPAGGTHVVAFAPVKDADRVRGTPAVTAEVIAVVPAAEFVEEWWAADHAQADVAIDVSPEKRREPIEPAPAAALPVGAMAVRFLALLAGAVAVTWRLLAYRPAMSPLFKPANVLDGSS